MSRVAEESNRRMLQVRDAMDHLHAAAGRGLARPHRLPVTKGATAGLVTDDVRKTYETLKARGAELTEEPTERPYARTSACGAPSATRSGSCSSPRDGPVGDRERDGEAGAA